jgi:GntR family transcriptional regulator
VTISKESVVPLHIQLADLIRDQVLRKELRPTNRLPSEREMCEMYHISRITVRKALNTLSQEGLVQSAAGKGTFIADPAFNEELRPLSSFTQDLQRRGLETSSRILEAVILPADDLLCSKLNLPRGAEVVRLSRLRMVNEQPIAVQTSELPHHFCQGVLEIDFCDRSLYDVLRHQYHLALAHSDTVIMAGLAQAQEAALLQLKRPAAVLISNQTTYLESGAVIEITRSVFHADRYSLTTHT